MPANIVTLLDCAANYAVFHITGSKGDQYTITTAGSEGMIHCTCPSWHYAPETDKQCKHTRQVWEQACLYNPQWREGNAGGPVLRPVSYYNDVLEDEHCPGCGGPMVPVRRAV